MHVDKYKQPDGWYLDEDGVSHETAEDILGSKLVFCGCGDPTSALKYVARALRLIQDYSDGPHDFSSSAERYNKMCSCYASDGEKYFVWYVLTSHGLLEHGTCVPGWVTDAGREFMEDVESLPGGTD